MRSVLGGAKSRGPEADTLGAAVRDAMISRKTDDIDATATRSICNAVLITVILCLTAFASTAP